MARLTLHRRLHWGIGLPYLVCIDAQPVGLMRREAVEVLLPAGSYEVAVKIVLRLWRWQGCLEGTTRVAVDEAHDAHIMIADKERWWNLLFDIDLVVWLAANFFTLPQPWEWLYHLLSEGFFALWLLRIIIIRKRYFKLHIS